MAILVVGGHSRNIGKTSVVCRMVKAFPEYRWTAIKISQHEHPEVGEGFATVFEERDPALGSDSSRYLAAGAVRSFWVRISDGRAAEAVDRIRWKIAHSENVVIESNSVLNFLQPDLSLVVLDASVSDFKASALRFVERADAILLSGGDLTHPAWGVITPVISTRTPILAIPRPGFWSEQAEQFIGARLASLVPGNSSAQK